MGLWEFPSGNCLFDARWNSRAVLFWEVVGILPKLLLPHGPVLSASDSDARRQVLVGHLSPDFWSTAAVGLMPLQVVTPRAVVLTALPPAKEDRSVLLWVFLGLVEPHGLKTSTCVLAAILSARELLARVRPQMLVEAGLRSEALLAIAHVAEVFAGHCRELLMAAEGLSKVKGLEKDVKSV